MSVYATGTTGTIGQHLKNVIPLRGRLYPYTLTLDQTDNLTSVLHLAAIVGSDQVNADIDYARKVNVDGTIKLAEEVFNNSNAKFVFASTSHVYEPSDRILTEDSNIKPHSNYAFQKFEAEEACREIFRNNSERLLILRVFSVLGWSCGPKSLAASIIRQINEPNSKVIKNGNDIRDFLSPKQIALISLQLCQNVSAHGIVNICSGMGRTVASAARQFSGEDASCEEGKSQIPFIVGDNERLKKFLGVDQLRWDLDDYEERFLSKKFT